jgi:hypothetical protein
VSALGARRGRQGKPHQYGFDTRQVRRDQGGATHKGESEDLEPLQSASSMLGQTGYLL